jgi:hypothetical protein
VNNTTNTLQIEKTTQLTQATSNNKQQTTKQTSRMRSASSMVRHCRTEQHNQHTADRENNRANTSNKQQQATNNKTDLKDAVSLVDDETLQILEVEVLCVLVG